MKLWIGLYRGLPPAILPGAPDTRLVARTRDPALVHGLVTALRTNRVLEDDGRDTILESDLVSSFGRDLAGLCAEIRRRALTLGAEEAENG